MSTIGRIFTVLNLILAACFVAFTGSYLKEASNYRADLIAETELHENDNKQNAAKLQAKDEELQTAQLQLGRSEASKDNLGKELKVAQSRNATLETRLGKMAGDYQKMVGEVNRLATSVKTATDNADQMAKMAMASKAERDTSNSAKDKALGELQAANFKIANLNKTVADKVGNINKLGQLNKEQKVVISLYQQRFPGAFSTLQPAVAGSVETVGAAGKLVTISLSSGQALLKAGYSFAIYNSADGGYLGEATVTSIDKSKNYAFAKMTVRRDGARMPRAGDRASTNLNGSAQGGN